MSKPKANRFWRFAAAADEQSGDLYLYGPISDTSWWGDEETPKQFLQDLEALGDIQTLNVHINSYGGDVFAAHTIGNLIRHHKAKSVAYIDGVAASAASVIAVCCDRVVMPSNTMMMVHNPLYGMLGYFYADELRGFADELDKIAESIIAVYAEKTNLDRDAVVELMDGDDGKGTWMTAQEAVDWGFADEVETRHVAASLRGNILNIGGRGFDIGLFASFPRDQFENRTQHQAKAEQSTPVEKPQPKEGAELGKEIKTVDELRSTYPELVAQVEAAARAEGGQAERERIKGIESIAKNIDPALVAKAKFEEPMDAKDLALQALQADNKVGQMYLANAAKDAADSGVSKVRPDAGGETAEKPKTVTDRFKDVAAQLDARRRGIQ